MNDSSRSRTDVSGAGWVLSIAIAGIALALGIVGIWLPTGGASGATSDLAPKEVSVVLTEFAVTPASIEVAAGQELILTVTNEGTMPHDLAVGGTDGTKMLSPGGSEKITIDGMTSSTEAWCTVAGHKEAGMVMAIAVAGSTGAATGIPAAAAGSGATIDAAAEPGPDWKAYDPALAPAPGGTVHNVEMHAIDKKIEVAPGVTQLMWTFDGKVPGTILRGKVGDVFNVKLFNDGTIGHSIDFHASRVAWNDKMRTIEPGESLDYQFKADYAGAWMYHCGTSPALHHIGNGMFGAIIIDPPNLPPVDHEYVFVQSELYLGAEGKEGDLTKMLGEDFDAVVFNGYYNQYKFSPIRVEPNERVRAWVIDDGPSENSAFHIVGTIFDTVWREGTYDLQPDARRGGSQVLDLQPAQGGFVEFSFAEAGLYPIVTHKFSNASKGALGLFQAGDVSMPANAGH